MLSKLSVLAGKIAAAGRQRHECRILFQLRFLSSTRAPAISSNETEEVALNWPLPAAVLARNPHLQLASIQSARLELGDRVAKKLLQSGADNFSKEALSKSFQLADLQNELRKLGADPSGTREALVHRLYDLVLTITTHQQQQQLRQQLRAVAATPDQQRKQPLSTTQAFFNVFTPDEVANMLLDARAEDVVVYDVRGHCSFTSYLVIATARSHYQVTMAASAVAHKVKERCKEVAPGVVPTVEGRFSESPDWLVVDAGSVVAQVFSRYGRSEYNLDELWGTGDNAKHHVRESGIETLDTITAEFDWETAWQPSKPE